MDYEKDCLEKRIKRLISGNEKDRLEKMFNYLYKSNYGEIVHNLKDIALINNEYFKDCIKCKDSVYIANEYYCINDDRLKKY